MWFSGFFFLILSLIVEVNLWWKLQASLIFLSGRTCTIGGWLNTFLPHCSSLCCWTRCLIYSKQQLIELELIDSISFYELYQRTIKQRMACWFPKDTGNHMKVKGWGFKNVLLHVPHSAENIYSFLNWHWSFTWTHKNMLLIWSFHERKLFVVAGSAKICVISTYKAHVLHDHILHPENNT